MIWKASLVLSLALCVLSDKRPAVSEQKVQRFYNSHHGDLSHFGHHKPEHREVYAWAYPSYEFSYYVNDPHTHDNKGQHEIRDGDVVTGNYWLIQPDGHKRLVKYRSDHKNGFQAEVNYLPHAGYRHEIGEHHEKHEHKKAEKTKNTNINQRKEGRREGTDRKEGRDERRGGERNDDWDRRGYNEDDRRHEDNRRQYSHRRDDDNDRRRDRGNDSNLWTIHGVEKERDNRREGRKDENVGLIQSHGQVEHWKHGRLVGWSEGRGRKDSHGDDDRRGRENYGREEHRGHNSYQAPIMNLKRFVPFGERLQ